MLWLYLFFVATTSISIYATEIGSESVISIEPHATFPSADTDNTMLAFGWFKNGFTLEDNTTACTFESVFPISGNIYMNGGDLYLNTDLNFNNFVNILSFGNFYADSHLIELPETSTTISATEYDGLFSNAEVFFYSDFTLSGTLKFQGVSTLNGHSSNIYFDDNAKIIIDSDSILTFKNLALHNISEDKIICEDDTSKIILDEVEWNQDGNYTFSIGSIKFINDNEFCGSYTFAYASAQTSTISSNASWKILDEMQLTIGRHDGINGIEPIYFEDNTSLLKLDNCTLDITASGASLTRGNIFCDRIVYISLNSTTSHNGLTFGDQTDIGNVNFKFYPSAAVYFTPGHVNYKLTNENSLSFKECSTKLIRADGSKFYLSESVILKNIEITRGATEMFLDEGKTIRYINCPIAIPGAKINLTGTRFGPYAVRLEGNKDMITITGGDLPAYIYVSNTNNYIRGTCNLSGPIFVQDSESEIKMAYDGSLNNDIYLSGGKITFIHDLHFSQAYKIKGQGIVNLSFHNLYLGGEEINCTSTIYWDGNHSKTHLNSNLNLSGSWTFSGKCSINGHGNNINLNNTGEIKIEKGSTLLLEKLTLSNVHENKFICLDNSSKIQLKNVYIKLDGNYTFSIGSFDFIDTVDFSGSYTFEYASPISSTIKTHSTFKSADNITFQTGRTNQTPITFTDRTSKLHLKNSTLSIMDEGFLVTKGTVILDGEIQIEISSTSSTNGLILGNYIESDDVIIESLPSAKITIVKGALVVNNVYPNTFQSQSLTTEMIRTPESYFYINNDFIVKNQTTSISAGASLIVKEGKIFSYKNCKVYVPGTVFVATGQRYNSYTTLLAGDDEIFIHEGILPLYTLIMGTNNKIHGTGSVSGGIILANSSAELNLNLAGEILNEIQLNGGTLNLDGNLDVFYNNIIEGPGIIDMGTKNVSIGSKSTEWTTTLTWIGVDSQITLNSTTTLSNIWTFSGVCTLDGNNNTLKLVGDGQIFIHDNSTLYLRNISILNLQKENLKCVANNSEIIFDNANLVMPYDDFQFKNGNFSVYNTLQISGPFNFSYESNQISYIYPNATIKMTDGSTFNYAPSTDDDSLINMILFNSNIYLEESSIHSTTTGMRLKTGQLKIKGDCNIYSDATVQCEGIKFGSNATPDYDINIVVKPESTLNMYGHFLYENSN